MEDPLEDSRTACRDNDHDTIAIISQAFSKVIESTKPKKHPRVPNKQQNWKSSGQMDPFIAVMKNLKKDWG